MIIKNIKITNFKSIYGTKEINFEDLKGLVKLSGIIGSGKTTLGEAILWGLFGQIKGQNNPMLKSWNSKDMEIDINLISNNKEILIKRNLKQPLEVYINGKLLVTSNKKDTQSILESEYYDVPRLAIERMCIISFNQFKSLANMNPSDTKMFLDDIFGFKTFTEYNNVIVDERKQQSIEQTRLQTIYDETKKQINYLEETKKQKQEEIKINIDINEVNNQVKELQTKLDEITNDVTNFKQICDKKLDEINQKINSKREIINELNENKHQVQLKINEYMVLGKQEKEFLETFKTGFCPTCKQPIDKNELESHQQKMYEYRDKINSLKENDIKKIDDNISLVKEEINKIEIEDKKKVNDEYNIYRQERLEKYNEINNDKKKLESEIIKYNNTLKTIDDNYDKMISDYSSKLINVKEELDKSFIEIGEWNEMNELFTKDLRYKLLNTLIPQINKAIRFFINKFEQPFSIDFDQEFKAHIFTYGMEKEISYNVLSTGQKKTLDLAIIFGVLQNIISSVNFNILFLDELFSNMDANTRNIMMSSLKETNMSEDRSVFIINHSEMADDYFSHKIRVSLQTKSIEVKKKEKISVKSTNYEKVF